MTNFDNGSKDAEYVPYSHRRLACEIAGSIVRHESLRLILKDVRQTESTLHQ